MRSLLKRYVVPRFDAALVGGRLHVDFAEKLGLQRDRIFVGYDVVDNAAFSKAAEVARSQSEELRESLGLPDRYVLSLGRLVRKKNIQTLVHAFALSRRDMPDGVALLIVGSGECHDELVQLCADLGLSVALQGQAQSLKPDVYFFPAQAPTDVPTYFALAELFVLPSVLEEWGLVVNEAMACGLPVIVSNAVGCAPELCHDGRNGLQFDPNSAVSLAESITSLVNDPARRVEFGSESSRIIADWSPMRFGGGAVAAAHRALLRDNAIMLEGTKVPRV